MKVNIITLALLGAFVSSQEVSQGDKLIKGSLQYDFSNPDVLNDWKERSDSFIQLLQSNASKSSESTFSAESDLLDESSFGIVDLLAPFFSKIKDKIVCEATSFAFKAAHTILKLPWTDSLLLKGAKAACKIAGYGETICNGYVDKQGPAWLKVIENMDFDKDYAGHLLSFSIIRACPHPNLGETQITLPAAKPISIGKSSDKTLRILHLTDLHFDPEYKEGTEADCIRPVCCQADSHIDEKNPKVIKRPASKWGEYKCDMPRATLEHMLGYIKQLHESKPIDMVLFTGDVPAHDIWFESVERSKYTESQAFQMLQKHLNFPGLKFYPAIGNHESVPSNLFPLNGMEEAKNFFLYPFLADQWKSWLPSASYDQVSRTGFYSVQYKDDLKVIVLNNNLCYTYNLLLLLQPKVNDPNGMFGWLIKELQDAEKKGSKVYITSHVPPANADCFQRFSITWHKIVKAYSHVIAGQFYGHTHYDQFEIYYKDGGKTKENAISNSFVAPSITTHTNQNPGFRLYEVDAGNYQVKDFTQYYANLNEASSWSNGPAWKELYSAKSAFKVPSSSGPYINATFWHEVTELFERDTNVWNQFLSYKYKNSGKQEHCDGDCRKGQICNLRASNSRELCDVKFNP